MVVGCFRGSSVSSFEDLISTSVNFWAFQDAVGPVRDTGTFPLTVVPPGTLGGVGPTSWLPGAGNVGATASFTRLGYTSLSALFAYSVWGWVRITSPGVGVSPFFQLSGNQLSLQINASNFLEVVNASGTATSSVDVPVSAWCFFSLRFTGLGTFFRFGVDVGYDDVPLLSAIVGSPTLNVSGGTRFLAIAGVGVHGRFLSDAEIAILQNGPLFNPMLDRSRRRGGSKFRAIGR